MKQPTSTKQRDAAMPVQVVPKEVLAARAAEIQGMVARRAHELYQRRGGGHGRHLDDWLQAEAEILYPCRHDLRESRDALVLRAEVPGSFTANQLQVSVEPRHLSVSGERQVGMLYRGAKGTLREEQRAQRIFRVHELPAEVDPSRVTAVLKDEILEVVLPKVASGSARGAA